MKINVNGKEVEAYGLKMKKENALEIIAGKKTLEIRSFNPFYCRMFTDKEQLEKNTKLREEGRGDECIEPIKNVQYIHFHDYNNSWFLDVQIDEAGISTMCQEDVEMLAEDFDFHDYDNEWQQFEETSEEEKPIFYWFHIKSIVGKNI